MNVLKASDEVSKENCLQVYKEEKRKTKSCIRRRMKEINEQLGMKINGDVQGNRVILEGGTESRETFRK